MLEEINFSSAIKLEGKLKLTPKREQPFELEVQKIVFSNRSNNKHPLQKQNVPLDVVRRFPDLRAKTNYFLAMFRLRNSLSMAIHSFLQKEGFYYVNTPIISYNDTEGSGETFSLVTINQKRLNLEHFFGKRAQLTVSGQLQAEALAQGLSKVYTFSPCFRAEKSNTTRHLAEF